MSETHEPEVPTNWPHGHVGVELTPDDVDECIEIRIHGVLHYLHSSTAAELQRMLTEKLDEWNGIAQAHGFDGV